MYGNSRSSSAVSDISVFALLGCLTFVLIARIGESTKTADTCGNYYMLPMFPGCDLFLEASSCFNDTHSAFVTMTTASGEIVHTFHLTFGSIAVISLRDINKAKHEGLIVRSSVDISLHVRKQIGDSMVVYPIDAFSRDFETPSLASNKSAHEINKNSNLYNGWLYILSPYNHTSITISSIQRKSESTSSTSSTTSTMGLKSSINLNAFDFHKFPIDTRHRYMLQSSNVFAVVYVQSYGSFSSGDNESLCENVTLFLLDFVPPYSARGQIFLIALPYSVDFIVFMFGEENTTIVLTTEFTSTDIILDQSGSFTFDVLNASSSWMTSSHPVTIFIQITLCSNSAPSPTSPRLCAENGFFLPSLEHYFTCLGNVSGDDCACRCPSVFQLEMDPKSFHLSVNASDFRGVSLYPLMMEDIIDITILVLDAPGFNNITDVIITTNTSFNIFRYNGDKLNFAPGGSTLGTINDVCVHETNTVIVPCAETDLFNNISNDVTEEKMSENVVYEMNHCTCEFVQDFGRDKTNVLGLNPLRASRLKISPSDRGDEFVWQEDDEDSSRPLIAVVVSLCVSIFAVFALISGYMLVEIMTRRKHVRNTKIRPFVY